MADLAQKMTAKDKASAIASHTDRPSDSEAVEQRNGRGESKACSEPVRAIPQSKLFQAADITAYITQWAKNHHTDRWLYDSQHLDSSNTTIKDLTEYDPDSGEVQSVSGQDRNPLATAIVNIAQRRIAEAAGLVAYMDGLEKNNIHLQSHLTLCKSSRSYIDLDDGQPLENCTCTSCTNSPNKRDGTLQEESETSHPKYSEGSTSGLRSNDNASQLMVKWDLEIKRKKLIHNDFGVYDEAEGGCYDLVDDKENLLDESERAMGGPVLVSILKFDGQNRHVGTKLEIKSPFLVNILRTTIRGYPGEENRALKSRSVYFDEPYMILFHNRRALAGHAETLEGEPRRHLDHLLEFMRSEAPNVSQKLDELERGITESIDFNTIWLLYRPGTTVYSLEEQEWRAFKTGSLERSQQSILGSRSFIDVETTWVEFAQSGDTLAKASEFSTIEYFEGTRQIADLKLVPSNYLRDEARIKQEIIERGRHYWSYHSEPFFQEYIGNAWLSKTRETDTTRVMIDIKKQPTWILGHDDTEIPPRYPEIVPRFPGDDPETRPCRIHRRAHRDQDVIEIETEEINDDSTETWRNVNPDKRSEVAQASGSESNPDSILLFCATTIAAFSLRRKTWKSVKVAELHEVNFDPQAFDKLVISQKHKDLVTAMAKSYVDSNTDFSDLVKGKGRGLVLLLHGSPGIGKTLTAECVAESERQPLYTITCGDLGVHPEELEKRIGKAFDLATRWSAVILLDEADVFLQERDVRDLKRNALVSVFLRELEYFDGILFLTTNRPGIIDEAFQSRIHVTINLPDLDQRKQLMVWRLFLVDQNLNEKEVDDILRWLMDNTAKDRLNGRQIRNNVRTATALAARQDGKISLDNIKDVLSVARESGLPSNDSTWVV